jgi:hypothetical protein
MRKLLRKQGVAPTAWVTDKCPACRHLTGTSPAPHAPPLSRRGVRGMAGCGWHGGLSPADADLIAAKLDM